MNRDSLAVNLDLVQDRQGTCVVVDFNGTPRISNMSVPLFEEEERPQSFVEVWTGKAQRNPFLAIGILGFIGCGIYGARSYRAYRATGMSTSVFLVQLRVIAQGAVVGSLCLALMGQAYKDYTQSDTQNKK